MTPAPEPVRELAVLLRRAGALAEAGERRLLGITGPPAAGKSTLATRLLAELGTDRVALVGMDGFHIGDAELRRLGRRDRKGAPDTFDRAGYAALLRRLRAERENAVYVPVFDREREDSVAAAAAVEAGVTLVVTEGNDLLHWPEIRPLLNEVWYLDPAPELRRAALVQRHVAFGKPPEQARAWAAGTDERNAELVARDRGSADLIVDWGVW